MRKPRTLAQAFGYEPCEPRPVTEMRPVVVAWLHNCHHCGTEFRAKRRDARLCSGRCRTAAARQGEPLSGLR